MIKPVSISLSPNTEKDDVSLAFLLLWQSWRWKGSPSTHSTGSGQANSGQVAYLENEFKNYLGVKYAISFNSGRSSLMAILSAIKGISLADARDEVLLQAFTCNAVPNPVIWSGLKPVYVDINEQTFNIDVEDLKRKITSRSRAVIVQHTFGLPAEMDKIVKICQENNLILIEDCAHSLGATYKKPASVESFGVAKKVGTMGQISFFSFSRDKVISSVYGGMVVTNDDKLAEKIRNYQEKIGYPSSGWILQQLLHPILMNWLILPTYKYFGKYLFVLFQELNILSKAVSLKEKKGERPNYFPKRLPNALAILAQNQFKKVEKFNTDRKKIADFYYKELANTNYELPITNEGNIFLRFTVKHPQAHEIIRKAWDNNLLIGDWYTAPIAPDYNKLEKIKYNKSLSSISDNIGYGVGSCPIAEKLAKITLNLPTHINISEDDARKVVKFLKKWQ
jgi:perosamine synthetase